jgi:metal transporter CNNM
MNSRAIASGRSTYNRYTSTRPAILGLAKILFLGLCQITQVSAAPFNYAFLNKAKNDAPKDVEDPSLWLYLSIAAVLVLLGGAFAGLTIA